VQERFVTTGSYPTRPGNRVRALIDGIPAFRRICESIESARRCVWATITFMWPSFEMPGGRGTALDLLEVAALRGIDVRLIFWRPDIEKHRRNAFWGSAEHFDLLSTRYPHINIRWDRAAPGYCQHQKTWLIDAGEDWATSFVGGINLNPNSLVPPGHDHVHTGDDPQNHDVYVEVWGPAVADVQHNFVQRWNEASERVDDAGCFGDRGRENLSFPSRLPPECGKARVQIQRTTHKRRYANSHPAIDGQAFDIAGGERANLDQYCAAIRAATRTIYIENQYMEAAPIVAALSDALNRGVQVLLVLPVTPDYGLRSIEMTPERSAFLASRSALSLHESFMLCGLAGPNANGERAPVYVHSKLMMVDGEFVTLGSCNLHHYSLYGNGELNVALQDRDAASTIMAELFREHIAHDVSELNDLEAVELFKTIAQRNRELHERGEPGWRGLAFSMEMSTYGERDQLALRRPSVRQLSTPSGVENLE
jgi:cardiolipin synthase A/B